MKEYQTIDGFGYTLTGGSARHIVRMDATSRGALLKELFATDGRASASAICACRSGPPI